MSEDFPEAGYIYAVHGDRKYFEEAVRSVRSVRSVDEDSHVTLVTPKESTSENEDLFQHFDRVSFSDSFSEGEEDWKQNLLFKARSIYKNTDYKYNLFLDSDTYMLENCRSIFEVQKKYDIVISNSGNDRFSAEIDGNKVDCYTPYNTGVVGFKRNRRVEEFFYVWSKIYKKKVEEMPHDQPAAIEALAESDCKVYVLDNNWNARFVFPDKYVGKVRLLHGRANDFEEVGREINRYERNRFWIPTIKTCLPYPYSLVDVISILISSIKHKIYHKL